jgi:hypothetical protein
MFLINVDDYNTNEKIFKKKKIESNEAIKIFGSRRFLWVGRKGETKNFYFRPFHVLFCLFDCLSPQEQFFGYLAAVANTGYRAANLDLCLVLMAFSSGGSFTYHTCCDTGPRFILSHLQDQQPRHTVEFKPPTYGSSDLYSAALTTAPRRQLYHALLTYSNASIKL